MAELCRRIPNQTDIIHQPVSSQNVANLLNVTSRRCCFCFWVYACKRLFVKTIYFIVSEDTKPNGYNTPNRVEPECC